MTFKHQIVGADKEEAKAKVQEAFAKFEEENPNLKMATVHTVNTIHGMIDELSEQPANTNVHVAWDHHIGHTIKEDGTVHVNATNHAFNTWYHAKPE